MLLRLLLVLLLPLASIARAQTFQDITNTFPIGTDIRLIQEKEPTAQVVPSLVSPISSFSSKENVILIKRTDKSGLVIQFYAVDGKVGAMMLSRRMMPGAAEDKDSDIGYLRDKKHLATFSALRSDGELNPLEVEVEKRIFGSSHIVALIVNARTGPELWVVDEKIFDPKTFFIEPSESNRSKLLENKRGIEQQKKNDEDLKKQK